jgi:hypothetical protein
MTDNTLVKLPKSTDIDQERLNLVNQLSEAQKDVFLLGLSFYAAYQTYCTLKAVERGVGIEKPSPGHIREMEAVRDALNRLKLKTSLNGHLVSKKPDSLEEWLDTETGKTYTYYSTFKITREF